MTNTQNYKFHCKLCDYSCSCKSEFTRHKNTIKHIKNLEHHKKSFTCNYCNGIYKHQPSLSRHMKTCKKKEQQENKHISESEKDLKIKFLEEKIKDKEEKIKDKEEIIKFLKEKYELTA